MSAPDIRSARSLLFVPGDRPERFAKAAASGADEVVLDLEDAVAPTAKAEALAHVLNWLEAGNRAVVRVNAVGTETHASEVAALAGTNAAVMLPKAEAADLIADVHARLGDHEILALIETAQGVRDAGAIAQVPGVARLVLGTVDLGAELGVDAASHEAFGYSRGRLVIASAAAGLPGPVDGVTVRLDNTRVLEEDLRMARTLGFSGKLCIHPAQVAAVNDALAPSAAELQWAERILAAVAGTDGGVVSVDGAMVDRPVVLRAERLVSRARPRR